MSVYEASITNPKKQLEFYRDLSEQLQRENKKLKENNKSIMEELLKVVGLYNQQKSVLDEIREYINGFDFEHLHEICEHNLVEVLEMILQILDKVKE